MIKSGDKFILDRDKKVAFTDEFLCAYIERGFGTMTKREIDLFVFDLLSKYGNLDQKTNYQLSIEFGISSTKIKNFRFERRLKHSPLNEELIKLAFIESLKESSIKASSNKKWIIVSIEDSFVRENIKARIKELGHLYDTSFNSEIVTMEIDAFSDLLNYFYENTSWQQENLNRLQKYAQKISVDQNNITIQGILKEYINGIIKEGSKLTVKAGLSFLTGGVSDIGEIMSKLTD